MKLEFFLTLMLQCGINLTWTHGIDLQTWCREGLKEQTWSHGIGLDSWYRTQQMIQRRTHCIYLTHGIDLDSWYRQVLIIPVGPIIIGKKGRSAYVAPYCDRI